MPSTRWQTEPSPDRNSTSRCTNPSWVIRRRSRSKRFYIIWGAKTPSTKRNENICRRHCFIFFQPNLLCKAAPLFFMFYVFSLSQSFYHWDSLRCIELLCIRGYDVMATADKSYNIQYLKSCGHLAIWWGIFVDLLSARKQVWFSQKVPCLDGTGNGTANSPVIVQSHYFNDHQLNFRWRRLSKIQIACLTWVSLASKALSILFNSINLSLYCQV